MAEEFLLGHPHVFAEQADLTRRRVVALLRQVAPLDLAQAAAVGHRRDAHVHVVEPHRVALRPVAGQRSVGQPVLAVHHPVEIVVDHRSQQRGQIGILHDRLDHRRAHRPRIVQRTGVDHLPHGRLAGFVENLFEGRECPTEQFEAVVDVVGVFPVAGHLSHPEHAGIGNAPLIARQAETAPFEHAVGGYFAQIGYFLPRFAVDEGRRRVGVHEPEQPVEIGLDVFGGPDFIRDFVFRLQGMQCALAGGGRLGLGQRSPEGEYCAKDQQVSQFFHK